MDSLFKAISKKHLALDHSEPPRKYRRLFRVSQAAIA
jgi:hypothetical protein